jgi:hypothetical protein
MRKNSAPDQEQLKTPAALSGDIAEPSSESLLVADALLNDHSVYKDGAAMRLSWARIIDSVLSEKR